MKRIIVASAALALVGAFAPWNGSAGGAVPAHRLDAQIKLQGDRHWVGKGVYGKPKTQQVTGVLRQTPGRVVAVIKVVNTGSETTPLEIWGSSIRDSFYGGASWPEQDSLATGESVTFRYVAHRGTAEDGASMPVDFTLLDGDRRLDAVELLLEAR